MKTEVQSAVDFLTNLLSKRIPEEEKTVQFNESLESVLCSHYADHWFPEKPNKGSAYRCIRIVNRKMDPLLARAGAHVGLAEEELLNYLPSELTLWIDPLEVSYRIGEDGSIGVLYEMKRNSQTHESASSEFDSSDDSSSGSLSSSPSQSQEYLPLQHQTCHNQSLLYYTDSYRHSPNPSNQVPADPMANHWNEYLSTFVAS